jgi:hypothetical protein
MQMYRNMLKSKKNYLIIYNQQNCMKVKIYNKQTVNNNLGYYFSIMLQQCLLFETFQTTEKNEEFH